MFEPATARLIQAVQLRLKEDSELSRYRARAATAAWIQASEIDAYA